MPPVSAESARARSLRVRGLTFSSTSPGLGADERSCSAATHEPVKTGTDDPDMVIISTALLCEIRLPGLGFWGLVARALPVPRGLWSPEPGVSHLRRAKPDPLRARRAPAGRPVCGRSPRRRAVPPGSADRS